MSWNIESNAAPPVQVEVESDVELRAGPRTAMFVAATCVAGQRVLPVRVRNMSRDGALLEGPALPEKGEAFELVRAQLRVSAQAMWVSGNQCGVSFRAPIAVAEWMARIAPAHQQQVDALVRQARQEIAAGRPSVTCDPVEAVSDLSNIRTAIALLEALEGALADDAQVIERHSDRLQSLDRALQLLRLAAGKSA